MVGEKTYTGRIKGHSLVLREITIQEQDKAILITVFRKQTFLALSFQVAHSCKLFKLFISLGKTKKLAIKVLKCKVISSFSLGPYVFFSRSRDNKCIVRKVRKRVE